jgi:membrane-associated protease RseP (regulator of RpoE activity)
MKPVRWKLILTTVVAVGVPCFVLAENSGPKGPPPDPAAQSEVNDPAAPAADHEPGDHGPGHHGPREEMHRFPPPKLEKAAFLGIATRPVAEELRAQFKLPEGTALLIDGVEDDSPAAKAGIKKFDILTKLDDQLIVNPEQLAVLIRMHKASDEVKLSVIHEAAATTVPVTLVEKDLPPLQGPRPPGPGGPDADRGHGPDGPGPMMGRMRGFAFGMFHRMGMRRGMDGRDGGPPGGPVGMRDGKGGPDGMHDGPGGPPGMFGRWGMPGPRREMGMHRGPGDDGDRPDGPPGPHGPGDDHGAPATQPAHPGRS